MFKRKVQYWEVTNWLVHKDMVYDFEAESKEDMFLKILMANNKLRKAIDNENKELGCFRFMDDDWELQEEYDSWWRNLEEEKREEIFDKS